jgi:hypothetical protein
MIGLVLVGVVAGFLAGISPHHPGRPREVAARLYLGAKTVEYHPSHIYAKHRDREVTKAGFRGWPRGCTTARSAKRKMSERTVVHLPGDETAKSLKCCSLFVRQGHFKLNDEKKLL